MKKMFVAMLAAGLIVGNGAQAWADDDTQQVVPPNSVDSDRKPNPTPDAPNDRRDPKKPRKEQPRSPTEPTQPNPPNKPINPGNSNPNEPGNPNNPR
jgi:penicillin-binding protein 1A